MGKRASVACRNGQCVGNSSSHTPEGAFDLSKSAMRGFQTQQEALQVVVDGRPSGFEFL